MKKLSLLIVSLLVLSLSVNTGFTQNNVYGDHLLYRTPKLVSLDLEGADFVDVLKMLSQQIGVNFVSTEGVKDRELTVYLEDVPVKQALDIIFKANNLAYDFYPDANVFVVKEMGKPTTETITKVFYLKYAHVGNSNIQKAINEELGKSTSAIVDAVKDVVTEEGNVTEEPSSNSLVVTDVPSQFPVIEEVIHKLDIPQYQVMIEVEILDVKKDLVDKLGVNWENGINMSAQGAKRTTGWPLPSRFLNSAPESTVTMGTLDFSNLKLTLEFLSRDTTTKTLARPKILTLSNETSEVNLTTDEVIGVSSTIVSGEGTTENVERTETGTKLQVTPQVNPHTKEVTLYVEVFNRDATDSGETLSGVSLQNIEERGTKSVIRLADSETLLIGGLINKDQRDIITKVPFLSDIPWLGKAFTHKDKDGEQRELLIFLTPRVVKSTLGFSRGGIAPGIMREQRSSAKDESIEQTLDMFSRQREY